MDYFESLNFLEIHYFYPMTPMFDKSFAFLRR